MKVLIACEESQAVCIEFRKLGHEAFSCDTQECSGGHPEWHIQCDVLEVIKGGWFITQSGVRVFIKKWGAVIGFPPCTYISNAGAAWLWRGGRLNKERYEKGMKAKEFFMKLYNADCPKIAIENPVPSKIFQLPKKSQIIEPWQFGDPYKKRTCLWLKGLPKLTHTKEDNLFDTKTHVKPESHWVNSSSNYRNGVLMPGAHRSAKMRSKTFPGIAKAMAEQWG